MTPISEEGFHNRDKRRKLSNDARENEEQPLQDKPDDQRDGPLQMAKSNKRGGRKKIVPVRVTRALQIYPRPESSPVLTLSIPPKSPFYEFFNENAPNLFPAFESIMRPSPLVIGPQRLPCGGARRQIQDNQARSMQPRQIPYRGPQQHAQTGQTSNKVVTTAFPHPQIVRKPIQNAPEAQLQPFRMQKLRVANKKNCRNDREPKYNNLGAQVQAHEIPNSEVPNSMIRQTIYMPALDTPSSPLQAHESPQPRRIVRVEIPQTMPSVTAQMFMRTSSRSELQSQGKPNRLNFKETHEGFAHTPAQDILVPQLLSTEIPGVEFVRKTATKCFQNSVHNSSGSLLQLQPHGNATLDVPLQGYASTSQKPSNDTRVQLQNRRFSHVGVQPSRLQTSTCMSVYNACGPAVQPYQSNHQNFEMGKNTQTNPAAVKTSAMGHTRAYQARTSRVSSSGVQSFTFASDIGQNLRCVHPQEYLSASYHSLAQDSDPRPEACVIPSWAIGRPLCHYLFNREIGDPDARLCSQDPSLSTDFEIRTADPSRTEYIEPDLEMIPTLLPSQPYLTWTWAHEISSAKPLDNLTSFSRAFPCAFNMWPCLSLEQIRDRKFLASCHDKNVLRLMGRYLMEHALDQIARCDPSSDLEAKWLVTPKNLYEKGTRNLIAKQDKEKGLRCSCKRGKEQNKSGSYGVSCSDGKCENRAMNIECVPGMCGGGDWCKNMRIQNRQFPRVLLQKRLDKGFGVLARETIAVGTMIGEYVGEVLNADGFEKRMMRYEGEHNFYFMMLTSKLYIDASRKGGISRFINHSCDANCVAEKWNAGGEPHIAIVAIRDIKPYEEITFSYQAQLVGTRATKCLCGSENCQGWLTLDCLGMSEDMGLRCSEKEMVVAKKIGLAHSDLSLAEEILQRVYGRT